MVDAYNSSRKWFTIIFSQGLMLFQFSGLSKTSNGDGHSLNAVFSSTSLESCIISCKRSSDIRW